MKSNFTGIIPARYASTRFPGKALAMINGVPMVILVWEKACKALNEVYIATDHEDILETARKFGADAIMTSPEHLSGTDRIAEAARKIFSGRDFEDEIIVNIQGDEPLIDSKAILHLCDAFEDKKVTIATLIHNFEDPTDIKNPNRPKVVIDSNSDALYFSRAAIPWSAEDSPVRDKPAYFQHIGVYAFRLKVLLELSNLDPTPLEQSERLEQLRWLENGYTIRCVKTEYSGIGIDTPEDLEKLAKILINQDPSGEK